jgi:hypothetical protein
MTKRKGQELLAIHGNNGIDILRAQEVPLHLHWVWLGDGDNSNYSTIEFTSNELSKNTYLQLPFYE